MKQSDSIAKLTAALVAVQQHINPIVKDRTNPHFRNNYATLDAIMESVRAPLAANGLAIVQGGGAPVSNVDGNVVAVGVETMLVHSSGEYVSSVITLPIAQASPQAVGSAITYGRRYGVAALLALTTEEDDDGNHSSAVQANTGIDFKAKAAAARNAPTNVLDKAGVEKALDMTPEGTGLDDQSCPKCGGRMWDNRLTKKNPKAPDYKCRDRSCDGVIWPPKGEKAPPRETVPPHTDDEFIPF